MRNAIWQKRIPTILGILFILVGIAITTYLVGNRTFLTSQAGPSETPENVRITNISDKSFVISYSTSDSVVGSINYGTDGQFGQTALDDRDKNGKISPHFIHYFTLKDLEPSTDYYFAIISKNKSFLSNGLPYKITTGPKVENSFTDKKSLSGKVLFQSSFKEAVVYVSSQGSSTISQLVKDDGSYDISFEDLRKADLSSLIQVNEALLFNMLVQGVGSQSKVKFTFPTSGVLPQVTISQDFDFTQSTEPIPIASSEGSFSSLSFPGDEDSITPEINTPQENQQFVDDQPRFTGTATPNTTVDIEIHSDENIKAKVAVDEDGNWSYRPPLALSPGEHTITVYARDASGILRVLTQTFSIFQSGTQVAEAATPSASPIPTIPNATLSPTPILIPSQTITLTPTLSPTISPTINPIATPSVTVTPLPPIEPPGNPIFLFGIMGIGITSLGIFILVQNRKGFI